MNILVTGISGYIGSLLAPRLQRDGHTVRGYSRHPERLTVNFETVAGDAVSGSGLERALEGIDVAYFLIHSMEPPLDGAFDKREARAAENFARAAEAARIKRIVYLGGMIPTGGPESAHLASRLAVENILLSAVPHGVALRASIVIGAQSRPFRFLVRLIERLPVLLVPAWGTRRTSPIDERDIVELLMRSAVDERVSGEPLDVGGRDVVTYGQLIDRIRGHLLVGRPTLNLRVTATPIAGRLSALIADEQYELVGPLMESLGTDLLPRDHRAADLLGVRLHSLDAAIEHALRDWEAVEPLAAR